MVARLLVTTAIEETWGNGEPVLFLGEWCKRFTRKAHWVQRDSEVVPYHWDDRAKLQADYLYLQSLYERLLTDLSLQLNAIHGVDHDVRYWRILVGPWLGYFTQILFDRWTSVHRAIVEYDISGTVLLARNAGEVVPNDMLDFLGVFGDDFWNHSIYSAILKLTNVACAAIKDVEHAHVGNTEGRSGTQQSIKAGLMGVYAKGVQMLGRDNNCFLIGTGLSILDELRICRRLGQFPNRWRGVPTLSSQLNACLREWTVEGESQCEFEVAARFLIPRHIPKVYLEGYRQLIDQTESLPWPKHPKIIWSSNSYNSDDVFKAWAASKMEGGTVVVAGQHGGHYGIGRWSFNEQHDIAISDRYLSWGWREADTTKVVPIGQFSPKSSLGVNHSQLPRALLVTCTMPQQSYVLYSSIVASQWLDYFRDQCRFVESLPKAIQNALTVRFYPHDYGWNQRERWEEKFPSLDLDSGKMPINRLIAQSRLYISTYNATTYLESFNMDVPTVIYWNPKQWELRDSAIPFFEELKSVGIFHESPESAAKHVSMVWDNVDEWWHGEELKRVLARFKHQYCRKPDNLVARISEAVNNAIAAKSAAPHHR